MLLEQTAVCILCREGSTLYCDTKPLGAIMYIQDSKIVSFLFSLCLLEFLTFNR